MLKFGYSFILELKNDIKNNLVRTKQSNELKKLLFKQLLLITAFTNRKLKKIVKIIFIV